MERIKKYFNFISENLEDSPIKKYGERFPLKFLSVGDKITYMGAPYEVVEAGDYAISVKPMEGSDSKTFLINQNMFDQKGFINKNNKPQKL